MATEAKRPRMDSSKQHHSKGKTDKRNYYKAADYHGKKPAYLEPGQRGFLVTCNMRERDCTRDAFRLLNEYADELYGKVGEEQDPASKDRQPAGEEEEEDISVQVQKQAEAAKTEKRQYRFQSVDTGAKNICFITTVLKDPTELALKILRDAAETKKQKSRNILRLMPIEVVTKANLKDIMDGAGKLFDRYFLKEPKTFAVIFNRRFNNGLERESVINALAEMISAKNRGNKANLKNPELAVIVEVIKGLVLISVVPEFSQLRKYNLMEICTRKDEDAKSQESEKSMEGAVVEGDKKSGEQNGDESSEMVAEENEAKNEEKEDATKGEEVSLSKVDEKPEVDATPKEETKSEQ